MQIKTFTYRQRKGSYWLDSESYTQLMDDHIQELVNAGWKPINSANDPGHVRLGKTLALTALTGGLKLFFGASRTAQTITLTFQRDRATESPRKDRSDRGSGRQAGTGDHQQSWQQTRQPGLEGWVAIAVLVAIGLLWVGYTILTGSKERDHLNVFPQVQQPKAVPVLDLPQLALSKRVDVEKALGRPSKYTPRKDQSELADEADYPWGIAGYNHSRLNFLVLRFQRRPTNYQEAFDLLNLPHPNPPFVDERPDGTALFWRDHPFVTGYTCCKNIAAQDIWISSDWQEMHVLILDLDSPEGWSDKQCSMYVQRTGLRLPRAAKFKSDPLDWPINAITK